jgi:hypothetical protein
MLLFHKASLGKLSIIRLQSDVKQPETASDRNLLAFSTSILRFFPQYCELWNISQPTYIDSHKNYSDLCRDSRQDKPIILLAMQEKK